MLARLGMLVVAPLLLGAGAPLDPTPYDALLAGLMQRYRISGASLAVSKDGRIVLSRAYGAGIETDSPFRIASLSKAITAVAILRLVDAGRLELDAPAFGILSHLLPPKDLDPRIRRITVRHLLHHQGGWDRDLSGDPPFRAATAESTIRETLRRRLDFDPGARAAYSNFGYAVLGRIIGKVTSMSYEQFVRRSVLGPAGIRSMRVDPALAGMDSHGGWLGSTGDYVRFLNAIDGRGGVRLLSAEAVAALTAPPPKAPSAAAWYAMGLMVRPQGGDANWFHDGALSESARTLAVRTHHGYAWAVFANRMPPLDSPFILELDRGLWQALKQATAEEPVNRVN
ncbi:MAG: serine hydrolase [Acidobacteria bacterium]|nr:serine hydrolase [Acidobacteriota bacterium]